MAALQTRRAIKSQKNPPDENFRLNFSLCVNEIISSSGTSDAEANKWIKLLMAACPKKRFPSYKSIKKESAISWKQENICKKTLRIWHVLDFRLREGANLNSRRELV